MAADNSAVLLFELPSYTQPVVYRAAEQSGSDANHTGINAAAVAHMHLGGEFFVVLLEPGELHLAFF